jgi:hypothetical protein
LVDEGTVIYDKKLKKELKFKKEFEFFSDLIKSIESKHYSEL